MPTNPIDADTWALVAQIVLFMAFVGLCVLFGRAFRKRWRRRR